MQTLKLQYFPLPKNMASPAKEHREEKRTPVWSGKESGVPLLMDVSPGPEPYSDGSFGFSGSTLQLHEMNQVLSTSHIFLPSLTPQGYKKLLLLL